mgnify:CR=1 FL=1
MNESETISSLGTRAQVVMWTSAVETLRVQKLHVESRLN